VAEGTPLGRPVVPRCNSKVARPAGGHSAVRPGRGAAAPAVQRLPSLRQGSSGAQGRLCGAGRGHSLTSQVMSSITSTKRSAGPLLGC